MSEKDLISGCGGSVFSMPPPEYSVFDCDPPKTAQEFFAGSQYEQVKGDLKKLMDPRHAFANGDETDKFLHGLHDKFGGYSSAVMHERVIGVVAHWAKSNPQLGSDIMNGLIKDWSTQQIRWWGEGMAMSDSRKLDETFKPLASLASTENLAKLASAMSGADGDHRYYQYTPGKEARAIRHAIAVYAPEKLAEFDAQLLGKKFSEPNIDTEDGVPFDSYGNNIFDSRIPISHSVLVKGLKDPTHATQVWRNAAESALDLDQLDLVMSSAAFKADRERFKSLPSQSAEHKELARCFQSISHQMLSELAESRSLLPAAQLLRLAGYLESKHPDVEVATAAIQKKDSFNTRGELAASLQKAYAQELVGSSTVNMARYDADSNLFDRVEVNELMRLESLNLVSLSQVNSSILRQLGLGWDTKGEHYTAVTLAQVAKLNAAHLTNDPQLENSSAQPLGSYGELKTFGEIMAKHEGLSVDERKQVVHAAISTIATDGPDSLNGQQLLSLRRVLPEADRKLVDAEIQGDKSVSDAVKFEYRAALEKLAREESPAFMQPM